MKLAILTGGVALFLTGPATPSAAQDLALSLSTREAGGRIAIAVYRDADSFRRSANPVLSRMIARTGPVTTVTLSDLPPGRYAVAAFHDTDGDGDLTLWPFGLPKEAYGFSRDARGRFGPPTFAQAAFDLPVSGVRQSIRLH
jgi:uncharacterized protein (DUF2141 family)